MCFVNSLYVYISWRLTRIAAADQYPSAQVIGNDLSPIQPNMLVASIPFTVRQLLTHIISIWFLRIYNFLVDDIEAEWVDDGTPYDFIHARYLCYSIKDFRKLFEAMRQAYKAWRLGGIPGLGCTGLF